MDLANTGEQPRRSNGTFLPGHKGIGGRPKANLYQKVFLKCVTPDDVAEMLEVAKLDAKRPGSVGHQARVWLLSHLISPRPQQIEMQSVSLHRQQIEAVLTQFTDAELATIQRLNGSLVNENGIDQDSKIEPAE